MQLWRRRLKVDDERPPLWLVQAGGDRGEALSMFKDLS